MQTLRVVHTDILQVISDSKEFSQKSRRTRSLNLKRNATSHIFSSIRNTVWWSRSIMEQLYDIKKRMKSVNEISQLTRAMKLVQRCKNEKIRNASGTCLSLTHFARKAWWNHKEATRISTTSIFTSGKRNPGETWKIGYFVLTGDQGASRCVQSQCCPNLRRAYSSQNTFMDNVRRVTRWIYPLCFRESRFVRSFREMDML